MPVRAGDLEVVAKIRDEVTPGMAGIGAAVAAVAAGLVAAGKRFADFEGSMNAVKAVTGASAAEMGALSDLAKEMGATTAFSAKEAADGMAFLGKAGFDAGEIIEALPATLNLAAAGQLDLATASDIASNVLSGFNKNTSELGEVTDIMALAAASANTSVQALGQGISIVGPVAANVGVSLEQTAAAIGLLGDKGVPAEVAATGLRGAISRLLNPSKEAAKALDRLGVTATDASGEMRPLDDIIGDLEKSGLSAGDAMQIFGQRAGPVMLNLVSTGADNFRKFTRELENSEGAAQDMADTMLEGLHGSFVKLESAVDTAMVNVGEGVSGVLVPVLDQLAKSATAVGDAFQDTEERQSESAQKTIEDWRRVQDWFDGYTTWFEERTGIAAEKAEEALRDRIQKQADESWEAWRAGAEKAAEATDDFAVSTGEAEPPVEELTRSMKGLIKNVEGVQAKFGQLTAEDFPNLIQTIADIPYQRDWKLTGEEIGSPLMTGIVYAVEEGAPEVVSMAESFSDDIATALLNGQNVSEALESAFKATAIPGIAKNAGDFIGDIIGKAAGPKIAGLIAGPIGGALAGLASGFLSSVLGALGSALGGGVAGEARDRGATKFRMSATGPQFYINGQWVDEDGNPVGGGTPEGGTGGTGASGGEGTAENPSSNAMGGPVGAGEYSWVGEQGKELVRFGQPGTVTPNHALGGDIVVQVDGREVARATARHLPTLQSDEGW